MNLQEICDRVITENEAVLNCLVFDLHTDQTLASASRPGSPLQATDMDAALGTGKELFRGRYVDQFVQSLATGLITTRGFVREVQVTNAHNYQFMAAIPGSDDAVLVLCTDKTLTLGLGWMAVHQAQDLLAESLGVAPRVHGEHTAPDTAPPAPEPPSEAALDPKPVPPPTEEATPEPLPNPLARRRRNTGAAKSAQSPSEAVETAEAAKPESPDSDGKKSWRWSAKNSKE
ncbi:MAG: hypothetical protein OXE40_15950 [Gammaproteobacteria bacterium]|nr:hypothetical protein [Gammaproteobacteria bacterium]